MGADVSVKDDANVMSVVARTSDELSGLAESGKSDVPDNGR